MARRLSLLFLATASPLILVLFAVPWQAAGVLFALLVMGYPVALIVIAVARNGRLGPLGITLLILLIFLET